MWAVLCIAAPAGSAAIANASGTGAPQGDAIAGKEKSDSERCIECHSIDPRTSGPNNGTGGKFAKLTGQSSAYIVKQIRDFRSGARRHDFMAMMARSVDDADIADIAAYFAGLPVMRGDGARDVAPARELYLRGDPARGVTACVECHGDAGKGRAAGAATAPVIGGQEAHYLERQLTEWRSGERHNSADGAMNRVTQTLTDREIQALASYLAGL